VRKPGPAAAMPFTNVQSSRRDSTYSRGTTFAKAYSSEGAEAGPRFRLTARWTARHSVSQLQCRRPVRLKRLYHSAEPNIYAKVAHAYPSWLS
jgi:hypothetical protein